MHAAAVANVAEMIGWVTVALVALTLTTQALHWSPFRSIALLQSLNVQSTIALTVVAIAAASTDRPPLGMTASLVALGAWLSVATAVRPRQSAPTVGDRLTIRVAAVNLLYKNRHVDRVGDILRRVDADLIFLTEYTPEVAEKLDRHGVRSDYPHHLGDPQPGGAGTAVWSRWPLVTWNPVEFERDTIAVTVETPTGPIAMLAVHPHTPVESTRLWRVGLDRIALLAQAARHPTLVIGDFNATYWHPGFRALLRAGFDDAHLVHGQGLSMSWPTNLGPVPAMLRLDHALTGAGLEAVEIEDFHVPGSDHSGIVVTVTRVA